MKIHVRRGHIEKMDCRRLIDGLENERAQLLQRIAKIDVRLVQAHQWAATDWVPSAEFSSWLESQKTAMRNFDAGLPVKPFAFVLK